LGVVPDLNFEIWLHGASLFAVVIFFWKQIWEITKALFSAPKSENGQLGLKLLLATACTIPVALFFESHFENFLTLKTVAGTLFVTGAVILVAEWYRKKEGDSQFTWQMAVLLGLVQGVAVIPGISRSGITIALLIFLGIKRKDAAEYSFLLSIPTILGALVFAFSETTLSTVDWGQYLISGFFAFIASILAIKWMIRLVEGRWIWFSGYCVLLGVLIVSLG